MERDAAGVDSLERERSGSKGSFFDMKEVIPPSSRKESIRFFSEIFGNKNPITVEIGSGNGHFLVECAERNPHKNYIGTEILFGRATKFSSKLLKRDLNNIVIFWGDTRRFVWEFLYDSTVEEFLVMFPDPWPKKRHHKHRLLSEGFIRMLYVRLVTGGRVSVITDYEEYRDFIIGKFENSGGFTTVFDAGYTTYPEGHQQSIFEERFRKQGRKLYHMQWVKHRDTCEPDGRITLGADPLCM